MLKIDSWDSRKKTVATDGCMEWFEIITLFNGGSSWFQSVFFICSPLLSEMIQFSFAHMFQTGWFQPPSSWIVWGNYKKNKLFVCSWKKNHQSWIITVTMTIYHQSSIYADFCVPCQLLGLHPTDSVTLGLGCRRSQRKAACQSQSRSSEKDVETQRLGLGNEICCWILLMSLEIPATIDDIDVLWVVFFVIDLTYACISIHVEFSVDLIWSLNMFTSFSIHLWYAPT